MNFDENNPLCQLIQDEKERTSKQPAALSILKRKFLAALNKTELNITENDEKLVKEAFDGGFLSGFSFSNASSISWTDSKITSKINTILNENQKFEITIYLNCSKIVFLAYSGLVQNNDVYKALQYVLTHARAFGNLEQNINQLDSSEDPGNIHFDDTNISLDLPDSVYMRKVTELIEKLRTSYHEPTYRILNVNVTYISLLILRRLVRKADQFMDMFMQAKTNADYLKLCPFPLFEQLPKVNQTFNKNISESSLVPAVILAIKMFLTTEDVLTKRTLDVTCIQYIQWNGLQLPYLFFKVVKLYNIEVSELWDSLVRVKITHTSLKKLSDVYYEQYKKCLEVPPQSCDWYPFCRAINGGYHGNLSGKDNMHACLILGCLVDLKIGLDKSFVRNTYWAKNLGSVMQEKMMKTAKQLSQDYPFVKENKSSK